MPQRKMNGNSGTAAATPEIADAASATAPPARRGSRAASRNVDGSVDKVSTSARIIEASIQLFNEQGVPSVPMHRIAAQVGISPGNLAYHFPAKRGVLLAILPQIESALRNALHPPAGPLNAASAAAFQIEIFRTLWRYRFFFNGLTFLLVRDEEMRDRYLRFQRTVIEALCELFEALIRARDMRAVAEPNTTHLVATNMWMVWLSWLRFEQINDPDVSMVENAAIYDGAVQHFSMMQPYYGKQFGAQLLAELQRALGVRKHSASAAAR